MRHNRYVKFYKDIFVDNKMIYQCKIPTVKHSRTGWNLVLDMDETLLHTFHSMNELYDLNLYDPLNTLGIPLRKQTYSIQLPRPDGGFDQYWGMWRPYLKDFLTFANEFFENVIIWSAGTTDYVHEIIRKMFRDHESPSVVLTRPDCVQDREFMEKPILKISDICSVYKNIDLTNTLIVDDRETAYSDTNPQNGIMIPAYEPQACISGMCRPDEALKQLELWFEWMHLKYPGRDVREFDKTRIFDIPVNTYKREIELAKRNSFRQK